MRIAVFSDVHGNHHALQAVLADIDANGPFDHIAFAGDLVFGAALPAECVATLRERDYSAVYGNTDVWVHDPPPIPENTPPERRPGWEAFLNTLAWTKDRIGPEGVAYLQAMPFELRFSPTDNPADDLLIVHANPRDVNAPIFPSPSHQMKFHGKIRQMDSDVLPLLEGVTARTIAFGHVHIPNVQRIGDYTLANIASVSRPQDNDWRCKYGVLTFADGAWAVEHRYVEYDVGTARKAILNSDVPGAEEVAKLLLLPD